MPIMSTTVIEVLNDGARLDGGLGGPHAGEGGDDNAVDSLVLTAGGDVRLVIGVCAGAVAVELAEAGELGEECIAFVLEGGNEEEVHTWEGGQCGMSGY